MNKEQYIYDLGVQFSNRSADINRLEMKLARLKRLRDAIYNHGQTDKKNHNRRETLLEYRQKVSRCDLELQNCEHFLTVLKERNGLIQRKAAPMAIPPRIRSKSAGRCKLRRNTPKYPVNADAMSTVAELLITNGDLGGISPEIKEWIIKYYGISDEIIKQTLSHDSSDLSPDSITSKISPTDAISAITEEIEKTNKEIQRERCCFW
jgi:hypothetical protein